MAFKIPVSNIKSIQYKKYLIQYFFQIIISNIIHETHA